MPLGEMRSGSKMKRTLGLFFEEPPEGDAEGLLGMVDVLLTVLPSRLKHPSECLNLSDSTLKKYRLKGDWIEGIHWVRINSRCVRYNLELIQDWLHNRGNPSAHLKAIQIYQQGLLSNQRRKRQ